MAAITLTVAQVKFATGIGTLTDTDATMLPSLVAALVEKYAPDAPDGVKLEASMRCVAGGRKAHPSQSALSPSVMLGASITP